MRHAAIRIRIEEPDFSALAEDPITWDQSIYGNVKEEIPNDTPKPLGKFVITTYYEDSNLFHDIMIGSFVTGILQLINKTPFGCYSKKQATCETATYGLEVVAKRTCTEQIMDIRNTLRYLGAPMHGECFRFGDNDSVVNSASIPHAKLY